MKGEGKMVLMCCLKGSALHLYLMQKAKKAVRAKIFRQIVGAFKVLCYNILNDINYMCKGVFPMEEAVLYAVENNIATITMNRPKSLNSMNDALIDGLHAAITKAAADAEVRAIVLTGNGKAFCAGGDLSYLNGLEGVAAKKDFIAKVGDVANVRIVKLMAFGAFAEVVPGVDGLIHISQIADRRIEKPSDVLSEGQMVDAKITAIDEEKQKISLSIRALLTPVADEEAEDKE